MAKTAGFQSVSEYIASHPKPTQLVLKKVRAILRKALPKAEEVISYQIGAYKLEGMVVIFFAAWKDHFSLYPATGGLVEAMGPALAKYEVAKGTIRFPLTEPVPMKLIERIAKFRAAETLTRVAAAKVKKKKAPPKKKAK